MFMGCGSHTACAHSRLCYDHSVATTLLRRIQRLVCCTEQGLPCHIVLRHRCLRTPLDHAAGDADADRQRAGGDRDASQHRRAAMHRGSESRRQSLALATPRGAARQLRTASAPARWHEYKW